MTADRGPDATVSDGMGARPTGPAVPTVMPWRYALTICGAALILGIAGHVVLGSPGSMVAMAGFAVGLFATLSRGVKGALIAGCGFLVAAAVGQAFPVMPVLLAVCMIVSALAVVEVALWGTRMSVMMLMGVILTAIATERGGDFRMLAMAAAGLAVGQLVMTHLRLSGILRHPVVRPAEAVKLGLFLGIGVALSIGLAVTINLPHAYWIVILFISRSLMPMQHKPGALFKYGHGAALGVLAAILIELTGASDALRLLLALAAFVLGLRFMPNPLPVSSAAMTAGILLASAPMPGDAIFRVEAILLVIALILFLTLILERVVPKLLKTPSPGQIRKDQ